VCVCGVGKRVHVKGDASLHVWEWGARNIGPTTRHMPILPSAPLRAKATTHALALNPSSTHLGSPHTHTQNAITHPYPPHPTRTHTAIAHPHPHTHTQASIGSPHLSISSGRLQLHLSTLELRHGALQLQHLNTHTFSTGGTVQHSPSQRKTKVCMPRPATVCARVLLLGVWACAERRPDTTHPRHKPQDTHPRHAHSRHTPYKHTPKHTLHAHPRYTPDTPQTRTSARSMALDATVRFFPAPYKHMHVRACTWTARWSSSGTRGYLMPHVPRTRGRKQGFGGSTHTQTHTQTHTHTQSNTPAFQSGPWMFARPAWLPCLRRRWLALWLAAHAHANTRVHGATGSQATTQTRTQVQVRAGNDRESPPPPNGVQHCRLRSTQDSPECSDDAWVGYWGRCRNEIRPIS
jgi:hypothetical protein